MSADVLPFRGKGDAVRVSPETPICSAPMSQTLPLPRVDVVTIGDWPYHWYEVQYRVGNAADDYTALGTFGTADEAETFVADFMAAHPELGGGA